MSNFKVFCIFALTCLCSLQIAQAAEMTTGQIELSFKSQDGHPVQGITLAGMLKFEALTMKDCTGPICTPGLPKYQSKSESAEILGQTNENGILNVAPRNWRTSALTAKNLSVLVFTNGTLDDLCNNGTASYYEDFVDLLPESKNGQGTPKNPECQQVQIKKGDTQSVQITCYSPYTLTEIDELKQKVLAGCP